jgi:uncharacterized phage-associated protein
MRDELGRRIGGERGNPLTAKYDAFTIAKWFIAWAEAEDAEVSNLKVQKLLYFAQGHHLATFSRPLFVDPIQAWSHGPVVQEVYRHLRAFGAGPIRLPDDDSFTWADVDEDTSEFLVRVWNTYGPIAAWRLRNMTHDSGPWKRHFVPDERHTVIPDEEIHEYFSTLHANSAP